MAERPTPARDDAGGAASDPSSSGEPQIDWAAIEREPEFQELVRARRSFVIPGTIFFLSWYMGFIVLTALAPDFMGERVYEGLTVGYVLALTQFLMVLVLGLLYLKKSEQVFDPLAEKAIARYADEHPDAMPDRDDRRVAERREPSTPTTSTSEATR
jgi:uncharacterized membrane protein (DUF485 family)